MGNIEALESIISQWPGVSGPIPSKKGSQVSFAVSKTKFCWLAPGSGMVQIYPPLGPRQITRRLVRHGPQVQVIRQRTGQLDAEYYDPEQLLEFRYSYPGFLCSQTSLDEAVSLVRQAYEQAQRVGRVEGESRYIREPLAASSYHSQREEITAAAASPKVVQVPMDDALVQTLDSWGQELGRSRADIIREACRRYLKQLERGKMDRIYQAGYDRFPEEPMMGQTQAALLGQVLAREDW